MSKRSHSASSATIDMDVELRTSPKRMNMDDQSMLNQLYDYSRELRLYPCVEVFGEAVYDAVDTMFLCCALIREDSDEIEQTKATFVAQLAEALDCYDTIKRLRVVDDYGLFCACERVAGICQYVIQRMT